LEVGGEADESVEAVPKIAIETKPIIIFAQCDLFKFAPTR
jgi:hypothetical protein